ncbi:MAG: class I SAM-dependent methyltransferase [Lachnospiraceae bacterium]|nr:class I SAM-dependent methyltransferase [Lachnospiraceae bacterium]
MTEHDWDKKLNINTVGRDDTHADVFHHPYEPTPYCVLERLRDSGYITQDSVLVDYGCGKGRVGFFLAQELGCRCIGLEYDPSIFARAEENRTSFAKQYAQSAGRMELLCENAEAYEVTGADCFYFFNPFSVEILRSVMRQIVGSYYENPRIIRLFFYYPDQEYISYLLAGDASGMLDELYFLDEIDCSDLFEGQDERERVMVFEFGTGNSK